MADIVADGKTRVAWVPTIANIAAPTTTELNAGILLHNTMTADGLASWQPETASVDTSSLASTFSTSQPGRTSYSTPMLRMKKQDGTDTIYTTLTNGTAGYVVVRSGQGIAASANWASTQQVRVYPVTCGEVQHMDIEANSLERYQVPTFVSSQPNLRAVVA